jgi:hypothetical protein
MAGDEEGEVARLRRQVKYLGEALATAKAQSDALQAKLDSRAYVADGGRQEPDGLTDKGKTYRVLEVNDELGMVILDGGRRDGLKPGVQLAVIEKDRAVATVRIVDVRAAVAGAVIQEMGRGKPKAQDRAVLVTGSRN